MNKFIIGIDIGGTNAPCAILSGDGKIINMLEKKTLAEGGVKEVIKSFVDSINELKTLEKDKKIEAIGIGAPGTLNHKTRTIITSPNLPHWKDIPIVDMIQKEVNIPVFLDNDANCAVMAEHWLGNAKGTKNVVLMTLGTGIGGGIIINNEIYRGSHGSAGEIGHTTISSKGTKCSCGNFGCLEAYASANATLRRAKEKLKRNDIKSSLLKLKLSDITSLTIYEEAEKGDRFSQDLLKETGTYLGIGIANIANTFDPDVILIGGGFSEASKYLIPAAIDEAYKRSFKPIMDRIEVKKVALGNMAGLIGAGKLALNSL